MRKKFMIVGLLLLCISAIPLFQMARELIINENIKNKYTIEHAYTLENGIGLTVDVQNLEVNGKRIEIVEEPTGKKASLTSFDEQEGVKAGDVVKLHLLVDGKEISKADEIWLSNRERGGRYYSWLDILKVNEKTAIVQRLTDDDTVMEKRKWKIIWIDEQGSIKEEKIAYDKRGDNPLAVRLIGFSGTSLMDMGYKSDILHVYPSIFFPILYPFGTGIVGILLCVTALFIRKSSVNYTG